MVLDDTEEVKSLEIPNYGRIEFQDLDNGTINLESRTQGRKVIGIAGIAAEVDLTQR